MIRNILLGILLSICILFTIFSLTIPNNNFINKVEQKYDISKIDIKEDLHINKKYPIYLVSVVLIILVGEIFIHTKSKHDINKIFVISFITMIIIGFIISGLNTKNNINRFYCIKELINYYLSIEIILFEIVIFKKYLKDRIFNFKGE